MLLSETKKEIFISKIDYYISEKQINKAKYSNLNIFNKKNKLFILEFNIIKLNNNKNNHSILFLHGHKIISYF